jgi:hypothetical protein
LHFRHWPLRIAAMQSTATTAQIFDPLPPCVDTRRAYRPAKARMIVHPSLEDGGLLKVI